jgi:phage terminase small subunit
MSNETQPKTEENKDTPIELTLDELAFVVSYFECNANATRAYMKLHPKSSYAAARSSASEVLTNPNIKAEIKRIWTERAMGAEEAIARMGAIARADLHPFIRVDEDGFAYFNLSDPQAQGYLFLIKEMETKRERRVDGKGQDAEVWEGEWVRVKLHDAYAALRDIAKMHGKLAERIDVENKGEVILRIVRDETVKQNAT